MNKFNFMCGWLKMTSWLIISFGLIMILVVQTSLFASLNKPIIAAFGLPTGDTSINRILLWVYSVLGATMAGWGTMKLFILQNAFLRKERWSWWTILISMFVWFIPDTLISATCGVYLNVGINFFILFIIVLPLSFTYQDFSQDISCSIL